jgi:tRNA/tmRNA/rRNA uracil-C5-methylase (TrmA/RlmC/RlmD family)
VDIGARTPADAPAHFHSHRAAIVPWLLRQKEASTNCLASAILDPPREGLDRDFAEIESGLRRLGVSEVAAVGCDANAWAQDVARFLRLGWRLERVAAFDLFPQTPHVEGIALLVSAQRV